MYELSTLERIVEQMHPSCVLHLTGTEAEKARDNWLDTVKKEKDRVPFSMIERSLELTEHKKIRLYIGRHQHAATYLVDSVHQYASAAQRNFAPGAVQDWAVFYQRTGKILEELLLEILRRFEQYIDLGLILHHSYVAAARAELGAMIHETGALAVQQETDPYLLEIALKPVKRFTEGKDSVITYRLLHYFRELLKQLRRITDVEMESYMVYNFQVAASPGDGITPGQSLVNIRLNVMLLFMNFNTPEYVAWYTAKLLEKLGELETTSDKIKLLRMYHKILSLLRLRPGLALMPELKESVVGQIQNWIVHELSFLKDLEAQESNPHPYTLTQVAGQPQAAGSNKKIQFMAGAAELALLIRTAPEAEIIASMAPMELLRTFQASFNSVGASDNSVNSLKNHYFNPKKSAATSLIHRFQQWIKVLRRYE